MAILSTKIAHERKKSEKLCICLELRNSMGKRQGLRLESECQHPDNYGMDGAIYESMNLEGNGLRLEDKGHQD